MSATPAVTIVAHPEALRLGRDDTGLTRHSRGPESARSASSTITETSGVPRTSDLRTEPVGTQQRQFIEDNQLQA